MAPSPGKRKPRRYTSAVRTQAAAATRQKILAAARELIVAHGFEAMTMQAIADRAGVALDTIYATVGRKPALVRLLVEVAISNRDRAVPAEERDYVRRIRAATSARDKLAIYAAAVVDIHGRLAPLVRAVEAAAPAHPEIAAVWREIAERRARNMRTFAADLLRTGELRAGLSARRVADILWATASPELYTLLVDQRGWTPRAYRAWLTGAWLRLLL